MPQTFSDVACTVCGCVCDDLRVTVEGRRVVAAEGACRLAKPWFDGLNADAADTPVSLDEAYASAAELLRASKCPLIYGLGRSSTDGQRAAVALADRLGGTIDTAGSHVATMAFQQAGQSTCTLGEVRQRADVVVFWGCDPHATHPRFVERYCPPRLGRTIVVVDVAETESARAADLFVPVTAGRQWEALWTLRMLVRGVDPLPPVPTREQQLQEGYDGQAALSAQLRGGFLGPALRHLAKQMLAAKFGVVVFGDGLTSEPHAHRAVESLFQFVTDLNQHTRCYALRVRGYAEVSGVESVLAWQTGYPFGVNFAAGYPRHNSGEFTGSKMLARGEPDLCLLVGSEGVDLTAEHLRRIPVIALDQPGVRLPFAPAVRFTTAVYRVHRPGTASRMDDVSIPLRVLTECDYPSDGEVLNELLTRVGSAP